MEEKSKANGLFLFYILPIGLFSVFLQPHIIIYKIL